MGTDGRRRKTVLPVMQALIWFAAQGGVMYNDDIDLRILRLTREKRQAHAHFHQRHRFHRRYT